MGRYVLLEFDDNGEAAAFFKRLKGLKQVEDGQSFEDNALYLAATLLKAEALGVFTKPAELCSCVTDLDSSVRGKKFGWWVCPTCKRPKNKRGQSLRNILDKEIEDTTRLGVLSLHVVWERGEDGRVRTQTTDNWRRR